MARASSDNLVGVLGDLGFLHLDAHRGDELSDGDDAVPFDFAAEDQGLDLDFNDELSVVARPERFDQAELEARERRRADLERIAGRIGGGSPPPLQDPDVFAWYQPIHYFGQAWGVFVRESGIQEVALRIADFVDTSRDKLRVAAEIQRMAHVALRLHETFHHKVESAATRMETISGVEIYKPYDDNVFLPLRRAGSLDLLEEALGNAWMFEKRNSDKKGVGDDVLRGIERFLRWWIPTMPGAYSRGVELVRDGVEAHVFHLTEQLRSSRPDPTRRDQLWEVTTHLLDPLHNRRSAHYIVVPRGQVPYLPHTGGPPKELALSHREVGKILKALGWERTVGGGRHPVKNCKDGQRPIPLPIHVGSIATGTLNAIAAQAGFANAREMVEASAKGPVSA